MGKIKMVPKTGEEVGKFKVTIVGDGGDANYMTNSELFTKEDMENFVIKGLRHLREKGSGHYQLKKYDNEYELPIPFTPQDSYCHTLESVTVEYLDEKGQVWTIEY